MFRCISLPENSISGILITDMYVLFNYMTNAMLSRTYNLMQFD